jgi:hypothetical protein
MKFLKDFHQNTDSEIEEYMENMKNNDLLYTKLEKAEV